MIKVLILSLVLLFSGCATTFTTMATRSERGMNEQAIVTAFVIDFLTFAAYIHFSKERNHNENLSVQVSTPFPQ